MPARDDCTQISGNVDLLESALRERGLWIEQHHRTCAAPGDRERDARYLAAVKQRAVKICAATLSVPQVHRPPQIATRVDIRQIGAIEVAILDARLGQPRT